MQPKVSLKNSKICGVPLLVGKERKILHCPKFSACGGSSEPLATELCPVAIETQGGILSVPTDTGTMYSSQYIKSSGVASRRNYFKKNPFSYPVHTLHPGIKPRFLLHTAPGSTSNSGGHWHPYPVSMCITQIPEESIISCLCSFSDQEVQFL